MRVCVCVCVCVRAGVHAYLLQTQGCNSAIVMQVVMDVMRDYSALSFGSTSQSLTRLVSVSSHFTCNLLTTITCTYGLTGIVKLPVDVDLLPA